MGLRYHFKFSAPLSIPAEDLEQFLKSVEADARELGFHPTLVINAPFNTKDRRAFAHRASLDCLVQEKNLIGAALGTDAPIWGFDPKLGRCHLFPERAVLLILTDESQNEKIFGFALFPEVLRDGTGRELLATRLGGRWSFNVSLDDGDERYQSIARRFGEAGFLEAEWHEMV